MDASLAHTHGPFRPANYPSLPMNTRTGLLLLLAFLLVPACQPDTAPDDPANRRAIFAQLVVAHPSIDQTEQEDLTALITAVGACEHFNENDDADLAHVVDVLWWEDHGPWPHETIKWVVTLGVVLLCPEHLERLDVDDPTW